MSTVYVYPSSGTTKTIVQDRRLCSDFEEISQTVIDKSEWSRFIQMWRKRVNMKSRIDFEFNLPGLTLVGLMPESPIALHVEVDIGSETVFIQNHPKPSKMAKTKKGEKPKDKAPAKSTAAKSSKAEAPKKRGREPQIDCEPADKVKPPRDGSMKAKVLAKAQRKNGVTIDEITEMYEEALSPSAKTPARIRAFEILKLLHVQNGYGFETEGKKIFALED